MPTSVIRRPIWAPDSPCRRAMTMNASRVPSKTTFVHVNMSAHVRRNGRAHRKRKPSASWARSGVSSRARSSWNGVPIASRVASENTGEMAPARNGKARPIPKREPPSGGATIVTVE